MLKEALQVLVWVALLVAVGVRQAPAALPKEPQCETDMECVSKFGLELDQAGPLENK